MVSGLSEWQLAQWSLKRLRPFAATGSSGVGMESLPELPHDVAKTARNMKAIKINVRPNSNLKLNKCDMVRSSYLEKKHNQRRLSIFRTCPDRFRSLSESTLIKTMGRSDQGLAHNDSDIHLGANILLEVA
jgi:hypothetical protein